jgi:twitching motility protein PilT
MTDLPSHPPPLENLLALALEHRASDLHLKAGQPPLLRVNGQIEPTDLPALTGSEIMSLADGLLDDRTRQMLREFGNADLSHTTGAGERFRMSIYRQQGIMSIAVRRVQRFVGNFEELHLPAATMARISSARQGLVIFAGTTGCGKSTSIASCLDYINAHRRCHVVTIEDPIEFLFDDKMAFVEQREIGTDVPAFPQALRALPREDPDVVMVGELRDKPSVEATLMAAETTRLVFTTVHSGSAPGVLLRLLDWFTADERSLIRDTLAQNLVAVICQRLVPCADPNVARVPATEVMLSSPTVRKAIRDGDDAHLATIIAAENDQGMHNFTQDLARLVREEWIDPKVAYEVAPNPEALRLAIRGIEVKRGTLQ